MRALIDDGTQVVCLDRTPATHDALSGLGVTRITGDIRDAVALSLRDARGGNRVPLGGRHGSCHVERVSRGQRGRNCALAQAAAEQTRPPVFVYVSSLAAAGPSDTPLVEASPCHPLSRYGRAKWEAEQVLASFADRLPVTIVRPPCVFGRGDRNLLQLCRLVRRGWEFHTHSRYRYSFLHVDDLVEGLITASQVGSRLQPTPDEDRTGVGSSLADPTPVTFPELSELIARCLRRDRVRHVQVPYAMAWLAAALGETSQLITRRKVYLNRGQGPRSVRRVVDAVILPGPRRMGICSCRQLWRNDWPDAPQLRSRWLALMVAMAA